jgi:signal transduction histidine kinase/CheY-like chemotaxis protein
MTNWFKAGIMLAVVLLGFWTIRYREKTLRINNLELESKVRERTQELEETAKQLRKKTNEAQRANMAKSQFLAGISHELRTPLNAILGFSQLLKRSPNLSDKQNEYVTTMHRSGEHLLSMINDVLDISKIEAGRMEVRKESIELPRLVNDIGDMFKLQCEEKDLQFKLTIDKTVPAYIFSDPGKIRQILVNLIGNAVKYTHDGSVEVKVIADSEEQLLSENGETAPEYADAVFKNVRFIISDTGPGIPDDQLESIFEPFKQVTDSFSDGTGLGLAITYRLITLLDGGIDVHSRIEEGSTFTANLPLQVLGYAENSQKAPQQVIGIEGDAPVEVLVVDDVDYNLTFLSALLGKVGMICLEAKDGEQAVQSYKKYHPDLILMDLRMPNMSGQEAMEAIRSIEADQEPPTPIIAVTASVFKESRDDLIASGFDEFLGKPFAEHELFQTIEKVSPIRFKRKASEKDHQTATHAKSTSSSGVRIKDISTFIQQMDSEKRDSLIEAIELMDWKALQQHVDAMETQNPAVQKLKSIIEEQDYSKLLSLNEWVNPS